MSGANGYYSLIQYCPDATRMEVATIGVLLFCPEHRFLKALTARDNQRIRRFFGNEGYDRERIDSFKRAIEERVQIEQPNIQTLEDLQQFIALRANRFQITAPRSMLVENPEDDLQSLFREIVGGMPHKRRMSDFTKMVGERFRKAGVERKLVTPVVVTVPVLERQIRVPFGFQNGCFNLIQPVQFGARRSEITACEYAVRGRSLHKNPHPTLGQLKLTVVGRFRSRDKKTRDVVKRVLSDNNVDLFTTKELDRLIESIRTTGKDVSSEPEGHLF